MDRKALSPEQMEILARLQDRELGLREQTSFVQKVLEKFESTFGGESIVAAENAPVARSLDARFKAEVLPSQRNLYAFHAKQKHSEDQRKRQHLEAAHMIERINHDGKRVQA
jgi:hypothetical protein